VDVLSLILCRADTPAHRLAMEINGFAVPDDLAKAADVARIGLQQLLHGPVYNWGQTNDVAGSAPNSDESLRRQTLSKNLAV
jgi:hypothetical protein